MTAYTILKEPPLKLLMAAYMTTPRNSAQEAICKAAVEMMLKLPTRKAITDRRDRPQPE